MNDFERRKRPSGHVMNAPRRNQVQAYDIPPEPLPISWASGKPIEETGNSYRGLFIDVGKNKKLDALAEEIGLVRGTMEHQDKGRMRMAEHWLFDAITPIFCLISALPYNAPNDETKSYNAVMGMMAANPAVAGKLGIRARWREGERSNLSILCMPQVFAVQGWQLPFSLTVTSTSTADLLRALYDHTAHLERVYTLARKKALAEGWNPEMNADRVFPGEYFFDLALPIKAGAKEERGTAATSTLYPLASAHKPDASRADYVSLFKGSKEVKAFVDSHWADVHQWANAQQQNRGNNGY